MGREDESLRIKGIAKLVVPIARTLVIVAAVTMMAADRPTLGAMVTGTRQLKCL